MQVSERQREANRRNAQASTGPKTEAGKESSSLNSIKHGLLAKTRFLPGENREDWYQLLTGVAAEFQPKNAYQARLVEEVTDYLWWCERQRRVETSLLAVDLRDNASTLDELLRVIELLHKISNEEYDRIAALYLELDGEKFLGELRSDQPITNFSKLKDLTNRLNPGKAEEAGGAEASAGQGDKIGEGSKSPTSEAGAAAEVPKKNSHREANYFSRNERFFLTLSRYSIAPHNRFLAVVEELRQPRTRNQS